MSRRKNTIKYTKKNSQINPRKISNWILETRRAAHSWVEDIDGLDGGFALLLEAKHQIDPLAQRLGHLVRLQRLAVDENEEPRVVPGPWRQVDVIHPLAVLPDAEIETCGRRIDAELTAVQLNHLLLTCQTV